MPFQSEKQRRYLWANEPEIARDWADTYGSRIEKNDGGIMRVGFFKGAQADASAGKASMSPGTHHTQSGPRDRSQQDDLRTYESNPNLNPAGIDRFKLAEDNRKRAIRNEIKKREGEKKDYKKLSFTENLKRNQINRNKVLAMRKLNLMKGLNPFSDVPEWAENMTEEELNAIARTGPYLGSYDARTPKQLEGGTELLGRVFKGGPFNTGNTNQGGDGGGYRGYSSYEEWLAAQNRGTGVTEVAEVEVEEEEDVPSNFQGVTMEELPYPNYHLLAHGGRIPRAFGGIMDSSTGRRGYFLGSIGKALGSVAKAAGKVFKSDVGKAAILGGVGFGFAGMGPLKGLSGLASGIGSSDIGRKLFMKNIGTKAANWVPSWGKAAVWGSSLLPWMLPGPEEDDEGDKDSKYNVLKNKYADELMRIKAGVSAGSLNPNQWSYLPSNYTYTGAEGGRARLSNGGDPLLVEEYKKYVFEMEEMGLTPMSFEEFVAQARAGMYTGGQSVPSDYTMEDAMMTTTQDKLGGITDVMKQADLYRQGSVGQFYAAQGGRIGLSHGGDPLLREEYDKYVFELKEIHPEATPMSFEQFKEQTLAGKAQGGRIGAQEGGLMDLGGMEKDYRNDGGFVPIGGEEKADDVPARLSRNEFVFTADAVRGAGGGDIDKGAEIMENVMENLEQGGQISEESQGLAGAQEMFGVSERLSEVV